MTSNGAEEEEQQLQYLNACLSVVVVGASGDLAKKKTFPSLLNLFADDLLPKNVLIWGYARSDIGDDGLRDRIRPYLLKLKHSADVVEQFLSTVRYRSGSSYGDIEAWAQLKTPETGYPGKCKDDITGQLLRDDLVAAARVTELEYFNSKGVWRTKTWQ